MRMIDADRLKDAIYTDFWEHFTQCHDSDQTALIDMVMYDIDEMPTLTPPNEPLPVLVNDEPDREYIDYICPRCKDTISQRRRGQRMETVYQCKFHDNCGQRVDWSNPQPYRRPPEGGCEIKDYAETCEECRFCDTTLASPPEGEEDNNG